MNEMELKIYNILKNIDVLDADIYSNLLNTYDEELVNRVIEEMIDIDINNLSKFDYYVSRITYVDDVMAKSLYDAYSIDLNSIPVLTREENIKLATEIYEIIVEMKKILDSVNFNEVSGFWISDKVEAYLEKCEEIDTLNRLKKLYNKFIYKRNMLTEGNLKLVISVGKQYYKKGIDINDIIQLGNIGLMKACERYVPSFNTCFSTYSYYWIKQNITRNLIYNTCPVSVSYGLVSFNILMRKNIEELRSELGREPTSHEIAEYMNASLEKVNIALRTFSDHVSLNEPINYSGDDDEFTFMDTIEDEDSNIFKNIVDKDLSKDLMACLTNNLTDNEFDILCHRYELNDCSFHTLHELGIKYGLSRERIRQIEAKAISKFKKRGKYLATYLG